MFRAILTSLLGVGLLVLLSAATRGITRADKPIHIGLQTIKLQDCATASCKAAYAPDTLLAGYFR